MNVDIAEDPSYLRLRSNFPVGSQDPGTGPSPEMHPMDPLSPVFSTREYPTTGRSCWMSPTDRSGRARPPVCRAFSLHGHAVCVLLGLLGTLEAVRSSEALGSKILGLSMRASALTASLRSSGQ